MIGVDQDGIALRPVGKTRLSLLLVDDDAELCSMMQEFIGEAGHHLDVAYNGRDGLMRILSGSYDLVILDVARMREDDELAQQAEREELHAEHDEER